MNNTIITLLFTLLATAAFTQQQTPPKPEIIPQVQNFNLLVDTMAWTPQPIEYTHFLDTKAAQLITRP